MKKEINLKYNTTKMPNFYWLIYNFVKMILKNKLE